MKLQETQSGWSVLYSEGSMVSNIGKVLIALEKGALDFKTRETKLKSEIKKGTKTLYS